MTQFDGAVIREQGVTFAVVVVKRHVLDNRADANRAIASFQPTFPGLPVILMAQDASGRATYYGRPDLSRFMANVPPRAVPWQRYTIN
jgi:hypothetical protein